MTSWRPPSPSAGFSSERHRAALPMLRRDSSPHGGPKGEMMDHPGGLDSADLDLEADRLHEECGVFGIFGHPDAAAITALGLHALQHRGQEAAGIVSFDGKRFHSERRMGLVGDAFSRREVIERLPGEAAIGHNRY